MEFQIGGVIFQMCWISEGRFLMGSPEDEIGRGDYEDQHEVSITEGFWLGKTPVTQAQWRAVAGENKLSSVPFRSPGHLPVDMVTLEEARLYCERLTNLKSALSVYLPDEAQWEYACRAGTQGPFGDAPCTQLLGLGPVLLDALGWFNVNSAQKPHPVGLKAPNARGLYDMHGNVWEMCDQYYPQSPAVRYNKLGSEPGSRARGCCVLRGGDYGSPAEECRAAARKHWHGRPARGIGFRLAAI